MIFHNQTHQQYKSSSNLLLGFKNDTDITKYMFVSNHCSWKIDI